MTLIPSILAADLARLADEAGRVRSAGAHALHVDVMDGLFVPNLSLGVGTVAALSKTAILPLDVHLMIEKPSRYVEGFLDAGANALTLHIEAEEAHVLRNAMAQIRSHGALAGLSVRPAMPVEAFYPYLDIIDIALIMCVEPGFGGQTFMPESLGRIAGLHEEIKRRGSTCKIAVDGGINLSIARDCLNAGAERLIIGSSIFATPDPVAAVKAFLAL